MAEKDKVFLGAELAGEIKVFVNDKPKFIATIETVMTSRYKWSLRGYEPDCLDNVNCTEEFSTKEEVVNSIVEFIKKDKNEDIIWMA